jgi:hypothetical protein
MVITWYHGDEGYVPDYRTGMRLVFFADTSSNLQGVHAFGNWDWHESADPKYYYYYIQGGEQYPTTTGLSIQTVSGIIVHQSPASPATQQTTPPVTPLTPLIPIMAFLLLTMGGATTLTTSEVK